MMGSRSSWGSTACGWTGGHTASVRVPADLGTRPGAHCLAPGSKVGHGAGSASPRAPGTATRPRAAPRYLVHRGWAHHAIIGDELRSGTGPGPARPGGHTASIRVPADLGTRNPGTRVQVLGKGVGGVLVGDPHKRGAAAVGAHRSLADFAGPTA